MPVSLKVGLKQKQKLIMTQSQLQAIELLQLSTIELSEKISEELVENPVIEDDSQSMPLPDTVEMSSQNNVSKNLNENEFEFSRKDEQLNYFGDSSDSGYMNKDDDDKKRKFFENAVAVEESLSEHLLWQARLTAKDADELFIYQEIITSLDENGFLTMDLSEFISDKFNEKEIDEILKAIQVFDPVGCGSKDVQTSLIIQAKHFYPDDKSLNAILEEYFEDLEKLNYDKISKSLNISINEISEKSQLIQNLDPFPGRQYSNKEVKYIIPDIEVKVIDGEIIVNLNDDWVPHIKINSYYINMLKKKNVEKKLKSYIQDKLQSARHLIKNISNRRETIVKVVNAIMRHQENFLLKGPGNLKPLTHIEIADEIEMHESTVSRVTSNKFVQTSWGVFELKYFFVSKLKTSNKNEEQSSDNAMKLIKDIVASEKPEKPYSDEEIMEFLKKAGIEIARRTIAKYRNILNIPSSSRRKKINLIKFKGSL